MAARKTTNKFIPTAEQRELVAKLSAAGMKIKDIASRIINPHTRKGIGTTTLKLKFKDQLVQYGRGRPRFVPTEKQRDHVALLCGVGLTYMEICECIINPSTSKGIGKEALLREFKEELKGGQAKIKGKVLGNLVRSACFPGKTETIETISKTGVRTIRTINHGPTGPAVAAAIFLSKVRYGWRDVQEVEVTTGTGVLVAPAAMTPEDWIAQQARNDRLSPSRN